MTAMKALALSLFGTCLLAGPARAETKVELKGTHLCCGACVKAADAILKKVEGVTGKVDSATDMIVITAKDEKSAQAALDALAAGGFHGETGDAKLVQKDDSGVTKGKVKTLTLTGVHNCCGSCNKSINEAVKSVAGVTGNTAKVKQDTFDVTGDFEAEDVVKAMLKAGFHVKVKK